MWTKVPGTIVCIPTGPSMHADEFPRLSRRYGHGESGKNAERCMPPFLFAVFPPPPLLFLGWVGVGWQRHCKPCRSLLELQTTRVLLLFFFLFCGRSQLVVELDHLCEVKNLYAAQVGMIVLRSVHGKSPKRQLHSTLPLLSLEVATPEVKLTR